MSGPYALSYWDVLAAALVMAAPYAISRKMRLGLQRDLLVGTVRVFVQLMLVGYLLGAVFGLNRPLPVFGVLAVMTVIAGWNAALRAGMREARVAAIATGVIGAVTLAVSAYVFYVVIGVTPYFNPIYVIPMMGLGLNGAMNAVAVGARAMDDGLRDGRERVEAALCLGATSWQAGADVVRRALKQAMVPTINGLMTAGIVQLPGVMTGQIISGVDPVLAVRYQVVIFYLLTGITATATIATILALFRRYFTAAHQLKLP
ncbi:MAG: iron export ABC transporter permease subunit FetB [Deltaproteobacteria bacterium]|nr:iron export ABC transporter permease subunit FetB [Deltaproteobacteria bacterium]